MFRDKMFLGGLGSGLIIGALLLQILTGWQKPSAGADEKGMEERVKQAVEQERMERILPVQAQLEQEKQQLESEKRELEAQKRQLQEEMSSLEQRRHELEQTGATAEDQTLDDAAALIVVPGMSAIQIAEELHRLGVIDDPDHFVRLAVQRGVKNKLRTGTYVFAVKTDAEQILTLLTTRPKKK
jgi:vacuolar-type H+-ATPase subunit I/STV1